MERSQFGNNKLACAESDFGQRWPRSADKLGPSEPSDRADLETEMAGEGREASLRKLAAQTPACDYSNPLNVVWQGGNNGSRAGLRSRRDGERGNEM